MRKNLIAVLMILFLALSGIALAEDFNKITCAVGGKISTVIPEDVNNDGQMDFVVSYAVGEAPNVTPFVALFFANDRGFPTVPDLKYQLPSDSCLFDLADLNGDGLSELVLVRKWQIAFAPLVGEKAGKFETLLKRGSGILFPSNNGQVPYQHLVRDWLGEGGVVLALPDYGSILFFDFSQNAKPIGKIRMQTDGYSWTQRSSNDYRPGMKIQGGGETPNIFSVKAGDDNRLVLTAKERVWVHSKENGQFAQKGALSTYQVFTDQQRKEGNMNLATHVEDLNGDGLPDLVLNKFGGGLTKFKSAVYIYPGSDGGFSKKVGYTVDKEGLMTYLRFNDLDGDGKKEMIMPYVDIGLMQMARMLMSQSLKVDMRVYKGGDGFYTDSPAVSKEMTLKVDTDSGFRLLGYPPDFSGDFDGDGLNDLMMEHKDGVAVWRNKGALTFASSPFLYVTASRSDNHLLSDLNGDGKCDFFAWSSFDPQQKGAIDIFINQHGAMR